MFDVGDLSVLTFGNCVLKTGVIKWPPKLYVVGLRFSTFLTFFCKIQKYMIFYVFLSCCTRFLERCVRPPSRTRCRSLRCVRCGFISISCARVIWFDAVWRIKSTPLQTAVLLYFYRATLRLCGMYAVVVCVSVELGFGRGLLPPIVYTIRHLQNRGTSLWNRNSALDSYRQGG